MTQVCIVGAGAIGGFLGTRLARSGQARISALARGQTLAALRQHGWRLQTAQGLEQAPASAEDAPHRLGPQDIIFLAVKAHALPALAPTLHPMIGPQTVVVPAMNGVPWWFGQGIAGLEDLPLQSVDPAGGIARALPAGQVLGCVVHASTFTPQPGLVQHQMGQGLIVGEPQGGLSDRAQRVVALLQAAGFDATASPRIRHDIWYKLWGNLTLNPITAITGATVDRVLGDPLLRAWCSATMLEAAALGARLGCPIDQSPEDRHAITAKLGAFKTSMLQDVEAGRALELDAIIGAAHEMAQRLNVPAPQIAALFGMARLFARQRGLYP
jgi:2-dehydropantoate 2-reductase